MLENYNLLEYVNPDKAKTSVIRGEKGRPDYKSAFFGGKVNALHQDYFWLLDLIFYCNGRYYFHQISTLENKAAKVKAIQAKKMYGWVWSRSDEGRKVWGKGL